jgi:hypothetical protein
MAMDAGNPPVRFDEGEGGIAGSLFWIIGVPSLLYFKMIGLVFNRRWTQITADAGIVGDGLSGGLC